MIKIKTSPSFFILMVAVHQNKGTSERFDFDQTVLSYTVPLNDEADVPSAFIYTQTA